MSAASASGLHLLGHKETHSEQESWSPTEVGAGFRISCPAEDAAVFVFLSFFVVFMMPCYHQVRNTAWPILFHLHNERGLDEDAIYNGSFLEESGIIPHPNLFVIQVMHKMIVFIDHSCNFHNTF